MSSDIKQRLDVKKSTIVDSKDDKKYHKATAFERHGLNWLLSEFIFPLCLMLVIPALTFTIHFICIRFNGSVLEFLRWNDLSLHSIPERSLLGSIRCQSICMCLRVRLSLLVHFDDQAFTGRDLSRTHYSHGKSTSL